VRLQSMEILSPEGHQRWFKCISIGTNGSIEPPQPPRSWALF
jgi:hypothetical protein